MATTTFPKTGDPELDAAGTAISGAISGLQKQFPRGTVFGNWLSDFGNLGQAWDDIKHLLFGYEHTGGDYALGEIFEQRVQGLPGGNRWDVPNGVIPVAWYFMTDLFGLPISVNTDLDFLGGSDSLEGYLQGRPEMRGTVTQAQVTRAHQLAQMIYPLNKYGGWNDMRIFSLLPYVAPIPDARTPGQLLTGELPNGQKIQNGVPVSDATGNGSNITITGVTNSGISTVWYIVIAIVIVILIILILKK